MDHNNQTSALCSETHLETKLASKRVLVLARRAAERRFRVLMRVLVAVDVVDDVARH
jgi:hypothetical protein